VTGGTHPHHPQGAHSGGGGGGVKLSTAYLRTVGFRSGAGRLMMSVRARTAKQCQSRHLPNHCSTSVKTTSILTTETPASPNSILVQVSDMLESYEREIRSLEGSLLEAEENLDNTRWVQGGAGRRRVGWVCVCCESAVCGQASVGSQAV
jgi:hypothetical protein